MELFHASPWVPVEWIKAHGVQPRGLWHADELTLGPTRSAAGTCAFAQAVVRFAETHPEKAILLTTHCDQLRRGFDTFAVSLPGRAFLFNLPATWQSSAAERLYDSELERLSRFLLGLGGHPPTLEALRQTIDAYARARKALLAQAEGCAARAYAEAIARFHWEGPPESIAELSEASDVGIPIALIGGPLPRAQWHLIEVIERAGARVALNGTEAGERSLGIPEPHACMEVDWGSPLTLSLPMNPGSTDGPLTPSLSPSEGERVPARAGEGSSAGPPGFHGSEVQTLPDSASVSSMRLWLARGYTRNSVDVFQRPNTRLYAWLKERLAARAIRGIVLWHYVGCDLWRAEAQSLREAFGLPLLLLDAGDTPLASARNNGRIEAFVESLR